MSDVSQIVTLVGHVGLFGTLISRQISSVEKNSTAIKQALTTCAGRAVVALLTSTAVAYPSFSRNTLRKPRGVSAPVSVDTRGVFRVEHAAPLRCVSPCYFPAPRRLLTALTPASTTAPMIKPSTGWRRPAAWRPSPHPTPRSSARWHDAAAQYRERLSPPTRNMASVPTMDNTFIRRGATAEPFTQPLRQRTTFFRQPVTHVVQLDDHPHRAIHPDSDQNRNPRENKDLVKQRSFRHDAEGNGDNFADKIKSVRIAPLLCHAQRPADRAPPARRDAAAAVQDPLCVSALPDCAVPSPPLRNRETRRPASTMA